MVLVIIKAPILLGGLGFAGALGILVGFLSGSLQVSLS